MSVMAEKALPSSRALITRSEPDKRTAVQQEYTMSLTSPSPLSDTSGDYHRVFGYGGRSETMVLSALCSWLNVSLDSQM